MRKNSKKTDSCKREKPADKNDKGRHTSDKNIITKGTADGGAGTQGAGVKDESSGVKDAAGTWSTVAQDENSITKDAARARDGYSPEVHARDAKPHHFPQQEAHLTVPAGLHRPRHLFRPAAGGHRGRDGTLQGFPGRPVRGGHRQESADPGQGG